MTRRARIEQLTLHEVRSYASLQLSLSGGVTVFVGSNGVGKTNLLEACAVALSGASPRTTSELRLVRDGSDAARIGVRVSIDGDLHERDVVLRVGRGKQLRVDGSPVRSMEEYARGVPVVTFLPERLLTIRGAPQRRRALIDQLTATVVAGAGQEQRSYTTALQQRNALLRRAKVGHDVAEQLVPWTQQLVEFGTRVRAHRHALLDLLAEPYARRFEELTTLEDSSFVVELRGSGDLHGDVAELASDERRRGSTLTGPHLDDLLPRVAGRDLRAFGSTGEQRAALLAFTFAAHDLLATHLGVEPVVLLDEPWSELDADRRRRLTSMLAPLAQVLVTSTEPPVHLSEVLGVDVAHVLQVSSGAVLPWPSNDATTD